MATPSLYAAAMIIAALALLVALVALVVAARALRLYRRVVTTAARDRVVPHPDFISALRRAAQRQVVLRGIDNGRRMDHHA